MAAKSDIEKSAEVVEPTPTVSETSSALDDTYDAYKKSQGIEISEVEAKKTLRKIDRRIVQILFFIYMLQ